MTHITSSFPIGSLWIYTADQPLVLFRLEQLFAAGGAESVWTTELLSIPDPAHPEVNALATYRDGEGWPCDVLGQIIGHHRWDGHTDIVLEITARMALEYWTRQPVTLHLHVDPARLQREWTRLGRR